MTADNLTTGLLIASVIGVWSNTLLQYRWYKQTISETKKEQESPQ